MTVELIKRKEPVGELCPAGMHEVEEVHWYLGASCGDCRACVLAAYEVGTTATDIECWVTIPDWEAAPERVAVSDAERVADRLLDICSCMMSHLYEISVEDLIKNHSKIDNTVDQ